MEPDGLSLSLYMFCCAVRAKAQASSSVAATRVRFLMNCLLGSFKGITRGR